MARSDCDRTSRNWPERINYINYVHRTQIIQRQENCWLVCGWADTSSWWNVWETNSNNHLEIHQFMTFECLNASVSIHIESVSCRHIDVVGNCVGEMGSMYEYQHTWPNILFHVLHKSLTSASKRVRRQRRSRCCRERACLCVRY